MITLVTTFALALAPGEDLDALRQAHAGALVELAQRGLEQQLYLDAERLLLEAREWYGQVPGVEQGLARLRDLRVASVQEPARVDYRAFLDSKDFARARAELQGALDERIERTTAGALDLSRAALRAEDAAAAEAALLVAFDLGADEKDLKRAAGRKLYADLSERWTASRGLAQLGLGERILGEDFGRDHLAGKVVVWRNFSL